MADATPKGAAPPPPDAEPAKKRRRSVPVRILRGLMWLVIGVVGLVLLAFIFLQTPPGKSLLKGFVVDLLNSTFQGSFQVQAIEGFLPFDVELVGVSIVEPGGEQALAVDRVVATFKPLELLDQTVHFTRIDVVRPILDVRTKSGEIALAKALAPKNPTPDDPNAAPWIVALDQIHLGEGDIQGVLGAEKLEDDLAIDAMTLDLSLRIDERGITWHDVFLDADLHGARDAHLSLVTAGSYAQDVLSVDLFEAALGRNFVALHGAVDLTDLARVDGHIDRVSLELDELPDAWIPEGLRGHAELSGDVARAGGVTAATLHGSTLAGSVDVVAELDESGATPLWHGSIRLGDISPARLVTSLPTDFVAQGLIVVDGAGPPDSPLSAAVTGEILEVAPAPGGRLAFALSLPEGAPGADITGRPIDVAVQAEGLDVDPWLAVAGQPELRARLAELDADGRLLLTEGGGMRVALAGAFDADAEGVVRDVGDLAVQRVSGHFDATWGGEGLPDGTLTADVVGARLGDQGVDDVDVDLALSHDDDGEPHLTGAVTARGVVAQPDVRVAYVRVPVDLTFPDLEGLPEGRVNVVADRVRAAGQAVGHVDGQFRVRRAGDGALRLVGGFEAADVRSPPTFTAQRAHGEVDALVTLAGGADGHVSARVDGGRAAGVTFATARVDGNLSARRGLDGTPRFRGVVSASGVKAAEGVEIGTFVSDVDVSLEDGLPVGTARGSSAKMQVSGRSYDRLDFDVRLQPGGRVAYDLRLAAGDLEGTILGVAGLPRPGHPRPTFAVDKLELYGVRGEGDARERRLLITARQIRLDESGLLQVDELHVVAPRDTTGDVLLTGTFDTVGGTLSAHLFAQEVDLEPWTRSYLDRFGVQAELPDMNGTLTVDARASGTLADPSLALGVRLLDGRLGDLEGVGGVLNVSNEGGHIKGQAAFAWHGDAHVEALVDLPVRLSLSPFALHGDEDAEVKVDVEIIDNDVAATQRFLDGVGAGERFTGVPVAGKWKLSLKASGPLRKPFVAVEARADPLDIGDFHDGRIALRGTSHDEQSRIVLVLDGEGSAGDDAPLDLPAAPSAATATAEDAAAADEAAAAGRSPRAEPRPARRRGRARARGKAAAAKDAAAKDAAGKGQAAAAKTVKTADAQEDPAHLVDVDLILPFDWAELIRSPDPGKLLSDRLLERPGSYRVKAGEMTLDETPIMSFVSGIQGDTRVNLALHVDGPLKAPLVHEGHVDVAPVPGLGADAAAALDMALYGDDLVASASASFRGKRVVDALIKVPGLTSLAASGDALTYLAHHEDFDVLITSKAVTPQEVWDLEPSIGELWTTFLPNGRASAAVAVRGGREGAVVTAVTWLDAVKDAAKKRPSDAEGKRDIVDKGAIRVVVGPNETKVDVRLVQDLPFSPSITLTAEAPLGTEQLVAGKLPDKPMQTPITGTLKLDEFKLDPLSRALSTVLGPSRGTSRGEVALSGTLGAPRLDGSLEAYFEELSLGVLGLQRNEITTLLLFKGDTIELVPIRLEGEPRKAGGESWLEIAAKVEAERLTARRIKLESHVAMQDFPLLARKDMNGRFEGRVELTGTAAEPKIRGRVDVLEAVVHPDLGGRSVRSLGLPRDVTLVTGEAVPPLDVPAGTPFQTGADIDVSVVIPKDKVKVENDMMLVYPWTDGLRARTIGGELSITGTVYVPRERLTFYGRNFLLTEDSRLVFTGDMSTDPQLHVSATYDISEVDLTTLGLTTTADSKITIAVRGSARDPRLILSSDPAMDEANIVSVIVIGAPVGPGEAEQNALKTQVANMVVGLATGTLSRFVTDQLPIDTFNIESTSGNVLESRLTVGKRLARDLFVRYRRNLGADGQTESVNEFSAEYRIGPASLLGKYGDIGEFSVEANIRFRD
ncbi:MAG: translocation/assembly module TamB domain-containing protein [Deltaproteobacteria bacterium]|nr:translocation/assembly module TamB domain-containing protein [Deltaproteobacteria bacterium]